MPQQPVQKIPAPHNKQHAGAWRLLSLAFWILVGTSLPDSPKGLSFPPLEEEAEKEPVFEYFRNPWQVVGLKDYPSGTRIGPDGRLLLPDGRQIFVRYGQSWHPIPRDATPGLLDGWLPVVCFTLAADGVDYRVMFWATTLPECENWERAFAWPETTDGYATWILVEASNPHPREIKAAAGIAMLFHHKCLWESQSHILSPGKHIAWAWRVDWRPSALPGTHNLHSGDSLSQQPPPSEALAPMPMPPEEARLWLERTKSFWTNLLAGATCIQVPSLKATLALKAAHVCQLITSDHGEVHAGEGFYDELYIRDGAYQILHLLEAGFVDEARRALERFLPHQREDGRFETQAGQLDANGQALWIFWKFFRMTGDKAFLERVYPHLKRAAMWIKNARAFEAEDSPFAGLLPAAVADGEYLWDGKHHIVGYDFWNLRGLLCVGQAAQELGLHAEARLWEQEAHLYRQAIERAWQRTGLAYFPPSWEKAGTHWGNTETLWPTRLFEPDDPRVSALIHHVRTEYGGGYLEGTIRWIGHRPAIHPYMGAYTALASLRRAEIEDTLADFFWYLLHSSTTHAFPEGIYPESRTAWHNTIPHALGAANYAILLRHMLIDEVEDRLYLLSAIPPDWLAPGHKIVVQNALTEFGILTMELRGEPEGIVGRIAAKWRGIGPKKILINVPRGKWLVHTEGISPEMLELVFYPPLREKWSYPRVVELYSQTAPPRLMPEIPLVERFPVVPPPDPERYLTIDLRPFAITNPFTAPFGVPRPGKFLFTGMPTGRIMICGIPFELINPARNEGRGLVVLHSQQWPTASQFPTKVEIPIGRRARRVYLLGNVAGWAANDPGTGPDQAVAEYLLVYADGLRETVPLVPGQTLDDWAARPSAEDVVPVLQGTPWHLNLLVLRTRDGPLEKIIFTDRGTPSAPLLAAMTVELVSPE